MPSSQIQKARSGGIASAASCFRILSVSPNDITTNRPTEGPPIDVRRVQPAGIAHGNVEEPLPPLIVHDPNEPQVRAL
jgi:hypothetical protein